MSHARRKAIGCVAFIATTAALYHTGNANAQAWPPDKYTVYWGVTTKIGYLRKTGIDWANKIDFNGAPINSKVTLFYQSNMGDYPLAGPHIPLMTPGYMDSHISRIQKHLDQYMPDPNYDGLGIIDYETWRPIWELTPNEHSSKPIDAHDYDFRNDWEEYMTIVQPAKMKSLSGQTRELYLRDTYEGASRDFYLATLAECRRLRPNAKWTFYGYPMKIYRDSQRVGPGIIGYGNLTSQASAANDRLAWLWGAVDFLNPSLYAVKRTVPTKEDISMPAEENLPHQNVEYILTNVAESVRLANGKPVLPMVWTRYQSAGLGYTFLNDTNLYHQLELPHQAGANGIILWDGVKSPQTYSQLQDFMTTSLAPAIIDVDARLNGGKSGTKASAGSTASSPTTVAATTAAPVASYSGASEPAPVQQDRKGRALDRKRIRAGSSDDQDPNANVPARSGSVVSVSGGN